jgi:hypothetical protein
MNPEVLDFNQSVLIHYNTLYAKIIKQGTIVTMPARTVKDCRTGSNDFFHCAGYGPSCAAPDEQQHY